MLADISTHSSVKCNLLFDFVDKLAMFCNVSSCLDYIVLTRARERGGADFALPSCFSEVSKKTYRLILTNFALPDQK